MINYRVSSAYAKSLLELAQEQYVINQVFEDMQMIAATFEGSSELRNVAESPIIASSKKVEIFNQIFSSRVTALTLSFVRLMSAKGREAALYGVSKEYIAQFKSMHGIQPAVVTTAIAIDSILQEQMSTFLAKISDKKLEITTKVDPTIVGGFVVTTGGLQFDASVKSKVSKFKNQFTSNPYLSKI